MLEGLVAAGFYSCFYGRSRGAIWTGAGAAGLAIGAFFFPEIWFAVPFVTAFWIMLAGFLWAETPGGKAAAGVAGSLRVRKGKVEGREPGNARPGGLRVGKGNVDECEPGNARSSELCKGEGSFGKPVSHWQGMVVRREGRGERRNLQEFRTGQREQLLLAGGIWLMARSLAEFGTGNALLQTGPLQTVLAMALLLMVVLYLLGRGRLYPLWMAALAVLWLLTGFLGSIAYAWPWQSRVMTVSLYLAAGGILVFQQVSCVRQELENVRWMEPLSGKPDLSIEGGWREAASREYRQLQIFEHDFRHHLDIVSALYEEGSAAEARAYIEDLKQARESRRGRKIGGERELSYIMMAKRQACREAEISFSYQIVGSPQGIAQMDMTALLLNLLDNAIRVCKEMPKPRSIGVMLLSRGELWEIEMINSGRYEPEDLESKLPERKLSERRLHGIGLVSVRQIVEKYQGTYRIWQEEGQVRQKLILVQRSSQEIMPGAESAE